jgi:hypothetical protein
VLAHLSYGTLEEPLWVVHTLNRLISVRGATLVAQLKSLLQLPPDSEVRPSPSPSFGAPARLAMRLLITDEGAHNLGTGYNRVKGIERTWSDGGVSFDLLPQSC